MSCVDATASYRYTQRALDFTARLVSDVLAPRDVLMARWIVDEGTAGTDSIILTTTIPAVSANQFDPRRANQLASERETRAQSIRAIREAKPPEDAKGTNILGCVAKADQLLRQTGARHSVLVMGSDLGENIELPYKFDLSGVDVLCFPCESEQNTDDIQWFRSVVLAAGANSFQVFDPQVAPALVLSDLKEVRLHA